MKIWIDKDGGNHYHREECRMIDRPSYEELERQLKSVGLSREWAAIKVDKRKYYPCPVCFGKYKPSKPPRGKKNLRE